MQRAESDTSVQKEEERVPFDTVPNPTTRVDQGADERAVRRQSRDGQHARPSSKDDEESGSTAIDAGGTDEKEFEVAWDGDDDPMNPRSMAYARKWVIVLIVSASSLCVCVGPFFFPCHSMSERDETKCCPSCGPVHLTHGNTFGKCSNLTFSFKIAPALLQCTLVPMRNWKRSLAARESSLPSVYPCSSLAWAWGPCSCLRFLRYVAVPNDGEASRLTRLQVLRKTTHLHRLV